MPHFLFALSLLGASALAADPPSTKKQPVADKYHGLQITDDYRWIEDGAAKEVQAWSDAQNAHARAFLDKLSGRDALRGRLKEILAAPTTGHSRLAARGGKVFAIKRQPPKEQPFLVVLPAPDKPDQARVLLDPSELDKKGTTAIDWFVPSPNGNLVAVSLSKGGSEAGDVHVIDAATTKQVHEVIPRVHGGTAGGDLAWTPDGKGFFYTRYPRGEERPEKDRDFYQTLWYHELGTPGEKDRYELGKDFPRVAEIIVEMNDATGRLLVSVQDGDGGRFMHFLRAPDGKFHQFTTFDDGVVQVAFHPSGESIYAVSRKGAPRGTLLQLSGKEPSLKDAKVILPEGKDTIVTDFYRSHGRQTVLPTANRTYVTFQMGGPSEIRAFDLKGKPQIFARQPEVGAVRGLARAR